ncbi:MAG: hypothetical protein ACTSVW_01020 [Candidatus Njordarchaeales archaeon]
MSSTRKIRYKNLFNLRGSPLLEEGLLMGMAIILFLAIVAIISGIMDWLGELSNNLPGVVLNA